MRYKLIIILLFLTSLRSLGQSFEGEWRGTFESSVNNFSNAKHFFPIKLYFKLNMDSSYTVYSYSKGQTLKGRDTTAVCSVKYKFVGKDSIYLEETEILKPKMTALTCFQKMKLKIDQDNGDITLNGIWESNNEKCGFGSVIFQKKKN